MSFIMALILNFMIGNVFVQNHVQLINNGFFLVNCLIEIYVIFCWGKLFFKSKDNLLA
jgi:hypothetical protein